MNDKVITFYPARKVQTKENEIVPVTSLGTLYFDLLLSVDELFDFYKSSTWCSLCNKYIGTYLTPLFRKIERLSYFSLGYLHIYVNYGILYLLIWKEL